MKIGIDLDGVVFNTEMEWAVDGELYDYLKLKKNSLVNIGEPRVQNKYNWNKEEIENYFLEHIDIPEFDLIPGAKQVLNLLKQDNHELIVITARGIHDNGEKTALNKIKEENLYFDKIYFKQVDKLPTCLEEKIDIMIDDNYHICRKIARHGIKVLYFHSLGRKHLKNTKNIKEVYNWGEIYRYISELKK